MALLRQYERDLFLVLKAMEEEEAEDIEDRYEPLCGVVTRSNSNWAVQQQKKARSFKF